ncbi:MAG: hypothetical protein EXR67_05330 [Dehalococcoidia bacterium]|nr:hypothetical protein [Dehalococcoidia bacterium]
MTVARISLMKVTPGNRKELEHLQEALEEFLSKQKGFVMGISFESLNDKETIGRITLWVSEEDANRGATLDHTVAIRSRMHLIMEPGHMEQLVQIIGTPRNVPQPLNR